ncbi:hypothetical protein QTG54_007661 [Skeletonema marinoi]|uniref:Uncharacterized protein n=1 Tax=Skeletonema marinoi TaxID=267567 RepID=A0AAD8Y9E2_9STRA|nr:hypothetical protein QTG54_007661 [Skeletonema marinoi]
MKTDEVEKDDDDEVKKRLSHTDSGGEDDRKASAGISSTAVKTVEKANGYATDGDQEKPEFIHDGCLLIPTMDCTNDSFFEYLPQIPVRDLLCWALRTENKIRLAKINRLAITDENENDYSYSRTLKSNCLIDIYPVDDDDDKIGGLESDFTAMRHEEYKFARKSHPQLSFMDQMDEDFNGLTPIEIEKKKSSKKRQLSSSDTYGYGSGSDSDRGDDGDEVKVFAGRRVVPPTMLHFVIIIEAFMGYSLGAGAGTSCYNSPDASLPRSAVMGGAVVAALAAYQDKTVVEAFEKSNVFTQEGKLQEERIYWGAKIELIKELHSHFIYKKSHTWSRDSPCSLYAKGDVDIFLQSSPLTQSLLNVFWENGIDQQQIDTIGSYIGNSGLCETDLERYVTKVMGENGDGDGVIAAPDETQFAYAVSKTAVSFILGKEDMYDGGSFGKTVWPRSSQMIMLDGSRQADLVGGMLDFDMSVVACSYDGISVRVAPRAAISLMTSSNFVTPFCFEEHRNKKRVIKYARRGFKPFLIDPQDSRPRQNVACDAKIKRKQFLPKYVAWYNKSDRRNANAEIMRIQNERMQNAERMLCCHVFGPADRFSRKDDDYRPLSSDVRNLRGPRVTGMIYTMKMFETIPGDAISFFKERFGWSADDLAAVNEVDPYLRVACTKCKNEYNLIRVVMAKYPDLMKEYDLEDDNLRGDFAYMHTCGGGQNIRYSPSFYGGGVFNSTFVRNSARPTIQILSMLHSQSIFEVCAYVMKHGSPYEYKKRFVYGSDLMATLQKASRTPLQKAARSPIGLNPERIVDKCELCHCWLLGNRYGVKDCQRCMQWQ